MATLEQLVRSWQASAELHSLSDGASVEEIEVFEDASGWKLPSEWRELYTLVNGADLFKDNLRLVPLLGNDHSLLEGSESYRHDDWLVPDELWIAGSDGEGNPFGLWLPAATRSIGPVAEMEQSSEPHCLAVAGSSLNAFLLNRTVYFLLSHFECEPSPDAAFDALGVPPKLRSLEPTFDPDVREQIDRWADPDRPAGLMSAKEMSQALRRAAGMAKE